jgi:uncharacterized membrane protein (UPF0182 family)
MRPPEYHPPPFDPKAAQRLVIRIGIALLILLAALQSVSIYVDSLWFASLGFEPVYWYKLQMQGTVFLVFTIASIALLWTMFRLVIPEAGYARRPFLEIAGERVAIPTTAVLKRLAGPVAIVLGVLIGITFSTDWNTFATFWNAVGSAGPPDPIFGRPVTFYLFTLPVLEAIGSWLLFIAIVGGIAAALGSSMDFTARFRGVSLAMSFLLLVIAFQMYVSRYLMITVDHNLFSGVRYVDHNTVLPGLWFVIAALIAGAAIAAANVRAQRIRNLALAAAIPAFTYVIAGILVPGYVSTFVVRPNELVRESPYIRNNIALTRQAFGLDHMEEVPFEPRLTNAVFNPAAHADTLDNIRLWDWRALQATLRQVQEIRTYYDFPDIDVDRYMINGKPQEMMLGVRELSLNKLPAGSQNWVNERLIYTHGYGVTMNPVSRFTKEGLPEFVLSNMPVESSQPDVRVTRPEIYFGEITDWPVYVKTRQKEFNYPEGDANNYSTYEGTGGIPMGSFARRLLLAWSVGDLTKVPFSDDVTADSALLIHRNIRERVELLAPFLTFDQDPYIVVGTDGRLYWMIDAFTTSSRYPYSRHINFRDSTLNYIRNSVKAVVDTYNGTVRFYIFDSADPIIQTYQKMFPTLFEGQDRMPDFIRAHVRYPELLFRIQATLYATYHVENEQVFYNREDVWTTAQQGRSQQGAGSADVIEPFFVLMRFPGDSELEFVSILPFTPANRNNLIGWMAGRSDGAKYGTIRSYHFPKTRFVDGPLQIQARIDQDPQLSSQLTLWNQQGSTVIRGNLLVLPLDDVLLFAEPMYLQAERSPMPELRLVVLTTQDRLAFATRFPEALNALLEGRPSSITATSTTGSATPTTPSAPSAPNAPNPPNARSVIERANQALADYQKLTAEGKLGEAGMKLEELKRILQVPAPVQTPAQ